VKKRTKIAEDSIIDGIRKRMRGISRSPGESALRVGIGDDAAIWCPRSGHDTILTSDWFLQGTHFLADRHPPETVGYKCLARAVSDVAAVGGEPRCFLLNLALPAARTGKWLDEFLSALRAAAWTFNCPLAGGDTTRRNEILINITVVGECRQGRSVLRSGANAGDVIFVTGRLGEAEYGLRLIQGGLKRIDPRDHRLRKHLFPEPRLAMGLWLAKHGLATAMIDISDGLSSDLPRLCAASGVGARVDPGLLPTARIAERDNNKRFDATHLALHGGDDYELLFTVSPKNVVKIPKKVGRVPVTRIGEITSGNHVLLARKRGSTVLVNKAWDPFR
jgi:thiamine-monophosphate kinase